MMMFDVVFWTALGLYCDQVIPSQFGIAKPWNFCCKCGGRRRLGWQGTESTRDGLLNQDHVRDK